MSTTDSDDDGLRDAIESDDDEADVTYYVPPNSGIRHG